MTVVKPRGRIFESIFFAILVLWGPHVSGDSKREKPSSAAPLCHRIHSSPNQLSKNPSFALCPIFTLCPSFHRIHSLAMNPAARGSRDAVADPPLPRKVSMAAAVDAVAIGGGHGRRGNPSPPVVGAVANPVQMQAEKNLAVGAPDLSAVAGGVVNSNMPLDPTIDATAVDEADAQGVAAGNVNGDGSGEVSVLLR